MSKVNFKCPACGYDRLEEVMINITQSSVITDAELIGKEAVLDYDDTSTSYDDGQVYYYACASCGWEVQNGLGMTITTPLELTLWLKSKGMLDGEE